MLSKIETGNTSPSLGTLQSLSRALNIPITAFFRKFEEERDASYVKAGEGLVIDRRGTRTGHPYRLLGHSLGKEISVEQLGDRKAKKAAAPEIRGNSTSMSVFSDSRGIGRLVNIHQFKDIVRFSATG